MGVRTLVGLSDGTTPAAAMYDSVTGVMLGPIFEGDDAAEQADAFVEWLRRYPFVDLAQEIGLLPEDSPMPHDGDDPRHWPTSGLVKLVGYWRRENLVDGRLPAHDPYR